MCKMQVKKSHFLRQIDIEPEFDNFTTSFRGGVRVEVFRPNIPAGVLNADYLFPEDNVIAELKCTASDPKDFKTYNERLFACYRHLGYTDEQIGSKVFGMRPPPQDVRKRMFNLAKRPVVEAIKYANKQVRSTKILLGRNDAKGLLLLANDNNYGFTPAQFLSVISTAFANIENPHLDAIVFLTPNVQYDDKTGILQSYWIPIYNVGSEAFSDFVNDLGRAWGEYTEDLHGSSDFRTEQDHMSKELFEATPVRRPV